MYKAFSFYSCIFFLVTIFLFTEFFSISSYSVEPDEFLPDPQQELRARNISKNIRCLVCQNQSIDESSSSLAKDLRIFIRNKITEGLTDKEIYNNLTERYGDFILLIPPFKKITFMLWFFPFIFLIIGIFVLFWHNRKASE